MGTLNTEITKTITIETSRTSIEDIILNPKTGARMLPPKLPELGIIPFSAISSILTFSESILDSEYNYYNELFLYTTMFTPSSSPYWQGFLKRNDGEIIKQGLEFGNLSESIANYSKEKLEEWFNKAAELHSTTLRQMEEKYWQNQRLDRLWG